MSNSSLVTYKHIVANKTIGRGGNKIEKIFVHHMAGNLTVKQCGSVFDNRQASAHYGVNGFAIGQYVDEKDTAWHCGNFKWNQRSIGIELANDGGAGTNWHVSDKTIDTAVKLIVDICKRNGIKKLNYTGDMSGNLCMHRWVASTSCPATYLASQFKKIANAVNKKLTAKAYAPKTAYKGKLPTKTVKKGLKNNADVKALQSFLMWRFGSDITIKKATGNFGDKTEAAVKFFQKKYAKQYGLAVDGVFGAASRKTAKAIVDKYAKKYAPTMQEKICAKAKEIADSGKYRYKFYTEQYGSECAICHPHGGANKGWNCIGYAWACWHHAGLPSRCSCDVINDMMYEKILGFSKYEDALAYAQNRIGVDNICVVRNRNGIALSDLKAGDVIAYFSGGTYVHTAVYIGNGKIADCTSSRSVGIKYGVPSYTNWKIKLAFRYKGK